MRQRIHQPQIAPRPRTGVAQISPSAAGAAGAGALAAGAALGAAASETLDIAEQRASVWATREAARMRERWTEQSHQRQIDAEDGAPDYAATLAADFDREREELLGSAPTDRSRALLEQSLGALGASVSAKALTFEAAERIAHREDMIAEAARMDQNAILREPALAAPALAGALLMIDDLDAPPAAKREMRARARASYRGAEATGLIERDPVAGFYALEGGGFDSDLDPGTVIKLKRQAQAGALELALSQATDGPIGQVRTLAGEPTETPDAFRSWLNVKEAGPGGYTAENPVSSASGIGQFVTATWRDFQAADPRAASFERMADAPPEIQDAAVDWLYRREAGALAAAGIEATPGNVAVAWRYGAGGARAILASAPDTPIEEALAVAGYGDPARVARDNGVSGKTVAEVMREFRKIDKAAGVAEDPRLAILDPAQRRRVTRAAELRLDAEFERRRPQIDGEIAMLADGLAADRPSRAELVEEFGVERGGQVADAYDQAEAIGAVRGEVRGATSAEVAEMVDARRAEMESAAPEDYDDAKALYEQTIRAAEWRAKGLTEDPVGFIAAGDPIASSKAATWRTAPPGEAQNAALAEYSGYILGRQAEMGVPLGARRILSNAEASTVAGQIMAGGRENMPALLSAMRVGFEGRPEEWRRVVKDLAGPGGLGEDFRTLARFADPTNPADQTTYRLLLPGWGMSMEEAKSGLSSDEVRTVLETVGEGFDELESVMLFGDVDGAADAELRALRDATIRAALVRAKTMDADDAAELLVDAVITKHQTPIEGGSVRAYAPAGVDADAVIAAADDMMAPDRMDEWGPEPLVLAEKYGSEEVAGDVMQALLSGDGVFITNSDATGVEMAVVVNGALTVPLNADGEPLGFTWEQLGSDFVMGDERERDAELEEVRSGRRDRQGGSRDGMTAGEIWSATGGAAIDAAGGAIDDLNEWLEGDDGPDLRTPSEVRRDAKRRRSPPDDSLE